MTAAVNAVSSFSVLDIPTSTEKVRAGLFDGGECDGHERVRSRAAGRDEVWV